MLTRKSRAGNFKTNFYYFFCLVLCPTPNYYNSYIHISIFDQNITVSRHKNACRSYFSRARVKKKLLRPNKCADERSSHQIIISLQNVRKKSNARNKRRPAGQWNSILDIISIFYDMMWMRYKILAAFDVISVYRSKISKKICQLQWLVYTPTTKCSNANMDFNK